MLIFYNFGCFRILFITIKKEIGMEFRIEKQKDYTFNIMGSSFFVDQNLLKKKCK